MKKPEMKLQDLRGLVVQSVETSPHDDDEIREIVFTNGVRLSLNGSPQIGVHEVWGYVTTADEPNPATK